MSSPDPTARREVKYALPHADAGKLRSILEVNCRPVAYRGESSRVVSLYFDDVRLSGCIANLDGTSPRSKIRLRWYDAPLPSNETYLEIKKRRGEATEKIRVPLERAASLASLPLREMTRELAVALPTPLSEALLARSESIAVVEYERRYFEAVGTRVRFTLDTDLVFYSQLGQGRLTRLFPVRLPELTILEAKAPLAEEIHIPDHLRPLEPRRTRSSKYLLACQSLGLIPGSRYGPV
jgi:hypothetical protein